jgi:hypothetical protein
MSRLWRAAVPVAPTFVALVAKTRYPAAPDDTHRTVASLRCKRAPLSAGSARPPPPSDGRSGCDNRPERSRRARRPRRQIRVDEVRLPWCGAVITSAASRVADAGPAAPVPIRPRYPRSAAWPCRRLDAQHAAQVVGLARQRLGAGCSISKRTPSQFPGIAVPARLMRHRLRRQGMFEGQRGFQHATGSAASTEAAPPSWSLSAWLITMHRAGAPPSHAGRAR